MFSAPKNKVFKQPFALAIGPQRSGTSWLDRYLRSRGDICMPTEVKEVFYFDRHYHRGDFFYKSHFTPKPNHRLLMEVTTTSFDCFEAPYRVKKTLGADLTLLCPLRHPVLRSYSLYLHYVRYGIVKRGLQNACNEIPQILESSHYSKHIQQWLNVFDEHTLHFFYQEDLENDQQQYLHNICCVLKIPFLPAEAKMSKRYNAATYSKSGLLAMCAQKGGDWLRKKRLYGIINVAKKVGLKQLAFGKENTDTANLYIPDDDRNFLESHLGYEIEKLEALIGPIPQWSSRQALHKDKKVAKYAT